MIKPKTPSGKTAALWLCLVLLYTLPLGPGLMAAENFTPRDKDEAWKWLKESLKHAGVTVDKVENNIVFARFDNKPLPINLEMTTSAARASSGTNFPKSKIRQDTSIGTAPFRMRPTATNTDFKPRLFF
jgi:hypothetical protein